jgi:hypothetical protein
MKKAQWILIQYGRVVFDQPKYEKIAQKQTGAFDFTV